MWRTQTFKVRHIPLSLWGASTLTGTTKLMIVGQGTPCDSQVYKEEDRQTLPFQEVRVNAGQERRENKKRDGDEATGEAWPSGRG
jgi:hypothetical protein